MGELERPDRVSEASPAAANPKAPNADAAKPAPVIFKKLRRESCMAKLPNG